MKKKQREDQKPQEIPMDDDDFFDDCPVCQYSKRMRELGQPETLEGLKEAFEKANTNN